MMLLERWVVAGILGVGLASTAGAPGQSPASQPGQTTQQTPEVEDAEPAEYHPPAQIGQPAEPPPAAPESQAPAAVSPPPESHPPAPASPPAQPVPVVLPPPVPDPPLSTDPVERQLEIDTGNLLRLAEELKEEVDKAGNNTLSLAAVRKADEVQKLARMLKEKMKDRGQVSQR